MGKQDIECKPARVIQVFDAGASENDYNVHIRAGAGFSSSLRAKEKNLDQLRAKACLRCSQVRLQRA
jgi:hypothetical protein